jgi:serine/threonine protein kinase
MGVVIVALDTKLQRPVAIKFLSTHIADAESRRRFQREAQLASSLNHPHILTVHDVGEFDGSQYLVSEFVDGRHSQRLGRRGAALLASGGRSADLLDSISTNSVGRY